MSHWVIIHCLTSFSSLIQKEFKFNLKYCLRRFLKSNASVGPRSSGTTLIFKQELFKRFFLFSTTSIFYTEELPNSPICLFSSLTSIVPKRLGTTLTLKSTAFVVLNLLSMTLIFMKKSFQIVQFAFCFTLLPVSSSKVRGVCCAVSFEHNTDFYVEKPSKLYKFGFFTSLPVACPKWLKLHKYENEQLSEKQRKHHQRFLFESLKVSHCASVLGWRTKSFWKTFPDNSRTLRDVARHVPNSLESITIFDV